MSVFSRTTSGISNYHRFHGADFTVFVEGKIPDKGNDETVKLPDIFYYEYVLGVASHGKRPKVKCVGNKEVAFEYAKIIRDGNISNSIVIVDKDLEGIISSPLEIFPVIRTLGYSWENELWSANTLMAVLIDLTNSLEKVTHAVEKYIPKLEKRLRYLSLLDAASQVSGLALLNKRSALCGISFSYPLLKTQEVRRISAMYKRSDAAMCAVASKIYCNSSESEPREVIQGHFWSNMVMRFITALYKDITDDTAPTKSALTNLALSHLRRDPIGAVGTDIIDRYAAELARLGI